MDQKVPNISDADIKRIIERDFPKTLRKEIESILETYKAESVGGRNRVYASILKLSGGNVELLKNNIEKANKDYRDIIALAEYPSYSEHAFEHNLPSGRKEQFIIDDWTQYEEWLSKK